MTDVAAFIHARLAEDELPPQAREAYSHIVAAAEQIRDAGSSDDLVSWFTGAGPAWKVGEYLLGADPVSAADKCADRLLSILAATWRQHPDYESAWGTEAPTL